MLEKGRSLSDSSDIYKKEFEDKGYDVLTAHNIQDAVSMIEREEIDAIVTDFELPNSPSGGLIVLQAVRSLYSKTNLEPPPVIIHTDYKSKRILSTIRSAGAYEVLTKSFDSHKKLVVLVEESLEIEETLESEQETQKEQNPYAESKILFVDGEFIALGQYEQVFADNGYNKLKTSSNEKEASEIIEQGGIDVVITDLKLDDSYFAGLRLLHKAKEKNPDAQVIFYTDNKSPAVISLAELSSAYKVITRSADSLQELMSTIAEALSQKKQKDLYLFNDDETMRRINEKIEGPGEPTRIFAAAPDRTKRELAYNSP